MVLEDMCQFLYEVQTQKGMEVYIHQEIVKYCDHKKIGSRSLKWFIKLFLIIQFNIECHFKGFTRGVYV